MKVIEMKAHSATRPDKVPTLAFVNEKISLATNGRLVLNMFVLALMAKVLAESIARERMYDPEPLRIHELFAVSSSFKID
jgi:hypothetical protein